MSGRVGYDDGYVFQFFFRKRHASFMSCCTISEYLSLGSFSSVRVVAVLPLAFRDM